MDVIQMTRDLGAALQQSDAYTAYRVAKAAADNDTQLQEMIGAFNLKKVNLSTAVQSEDKDPDKVAELNREVREIYEEIMTSPVMMACNTTRDELDRTLQFMQQILVSSANGEDPQTVTEQVDCGGDCGGCAGCN